jgi:hypothetical protein
MIFDYIETFYTTTRIHRFLAIQSPLIFERSLNNIQPSFYCLLFEERSLPAADQAGLCLVTGNWGHAP